ncbi:nucleolar essential protein 1 [Stylonychia lemnae]|uniref:Nucleolar essential protein 1 n=1 Tax=Stylonychia lemnae TaxID=5949 RepID=A0A078ATM1_STYLE|nr:nucleolar essential protein 1 [Stylonychia lemnae]|eukprot:CDW84198.1 nucleolar essential protein 1 [Stylonychia lemnae]
MESKHKSKQIEKQDLKDRSKKQQRQQQDDNSENSDDGQDFNDDVGIDEEIVVVPSQVTQNAGGRDDYHTRQRLVVILEQATLEIAQTKRGIELINCDDHEKLITKMKRSPEDFRPDIAHQIYIRTSKNVLIEINPQIRLPRTFKRFSGLMAQLLTKQRISAPVLESQSRSNNDNFLMKVIRPPISSYLPKGAKRIGMSVKGKLVNFRQHVREALDVQDKPVIFVVGCTSIGNPTVDLEYTDDTISISHYPLSAQCVCSKICNTFTDFWNIL